MRARERTARRYAKALHGIAREGGAADAVGRELEAFFQALASQPEARDVLTRPWIKAQDRRGIAATLAERLIKKSLRDEDHHRIVEDTIARLEKVT